MNAEDINEIEVNLEKISIDRREIEYKLELIKQLTIDTAMRLHRIKARLEFAKEEELEK